MAQLASLTHAAEPLRPSSETLTSDHIGFDAWLLPPEAPSVIEQVIRTCSFLAGPIAFGGTLACVLAWIA